MTTKYLAKFQSSTAVSWPKSIQPEWISKLWLYTLIPKIKSISPSIAKKKWWQLNTNVFGQISKSKCITPPKIIGPEWNVNLICNLSLYTHVPKIKSMSPIIAKKVVTTKYLTKFQSPRAITRPNISGGDIQKCNKIIWLFHYGGLFVWFFFCPVP